MPLSLALLLCTGDDLLYDLMPSSRSGCRTYMSSAIKKIVERGIEEEELGPEAFEVFERWGGMRLRASVSNARSSGSTSRSS